MTISNRTSADSARWRRLAAVAAAGYLTAVALPAVAADPGAGSPSPAPTSGRQTSNSSSANRATFGIGPARGSRPDPTRAYLDFVTRPGRHLTDHVIVVNLSPAPLKIAVYATDAVNTANGDFGLLDPAVRPRDAGTWVVVGTPGQSGSVTIPARGSAVLPVQISVPPGATPGDHAAGVVASVASVSKDRNGANVRLLQRVGTRVFIRVSGPLRPKLSVERLSAHYADNWNPVAAGSAVVTYRLTNAGNVKLGAAQQVSVRGLVGTTAQAAPKSLPLLLPGSRVDVRVVVPGVPPALSMTATVRLTPIVPNDTDTGLRIWSASVHFWAVPWIWLAAAVALVLAATWWARRRRAARRRPPTAPHRDSPAHREGPLHRDRPKPQLAGRHRA